MMGVVEDGVLKDGSANDLFTKNGEGIGEDRAIYDGPADKWAAHDECC